MPPSFEYAIEGFCLTLRAENKSENTIKSYVEALRLLCAFLGAMGMPLSPDAVRREHIEAFLADLRTHPTKRTGRPQSPATVANRYRSLAVFFNWCVEEDEIAVSPMARMKAPRVPDKATDVITVEEIRKLLSVCDRDKSFYGRRDYAIIRILIDTGLRRAEIGRLQMQDVIRRERDWYLRVTVKGGDEALSRLGYKAAKALYKYLGARSRFYGQEAPALWLGTSGPLTPRGIAWILSRRAKEAGVKDIRPHRFRFTFTHLALASGMSEADVQQLGHWRDSKMVRHYGKALATERAHEAHRRHSPGDEI